MWVGQWLGTVCCVRYLNPTFLCNSPFNSKFTATVLYIRIWFRFFYDKFGALDIRNICCRFCFIFQWLSFHKSFFINGKYWTLRFNTKRPEDFYSHLYANWHLRKRTDLSLTGQQNSGDRFFGIFLCLWGSKLSVWHLQESDITLSRKRTPP